MEDCFDHLQLIANAVGSPPTLTIGLSSNMYGLTNTQTHGISSSRISSLIKWTGVGEGSGEKPSTAEKGFLDRFHSTRCVSRTLLVVM